jgi:hypothetical protein
VPRPFRLRGIVEGFYGTPWSDTARRDVLPAADQAERATWLRDRRLG